MGIAEKIKESHVANIAAFIDLPIQHKQSLLQRYAVELGVIDRLEGGSFTESDLLPGIETLSLSGWAKILAKADSLIGGAKILTADLKTSWLCGEIMLTHPEISNDFPSFDEYSRWYKAGGGVPSYAQDSVWPCILSGNDEVLEDGWHRLHCYVSGGAAEIPVVLPLERL
tara:strand:- start:3281 stop:3790 length:510 start_codon:yes stop_codon:yes gene_type:complete